MLYVIIGGGIAGLTAAEAIFEREPGAAVTMLSEEPHPPYCRPLISYLLAGEEKRDLLPLPSEALSRIDFRSGVKVSSIDPAQKSITLEDGKKLAYDKLLIATGSSPAKLSIPGEDAPNVFCFRTVEDMEKIAHVVKMGAKRAVVLGGGLIGVKASLALAHLGVETILAVTSSLPLSQVVDREAGRMALAELKKEGVEVRTSHTPAEIVLENGYAAGVRFSEPESSIPCCLVISAKGMKPRSELLEGFGFEVSGGIPVDSNLKTPLEDIYAAGDVTLCKDMPSGEPRNTALWPVAVDQGRVAGLNMAGAKEVYEGSFARNSFRIGELHFVSAGMVKPMGDNSFAFSEHLKGGGYRRALAHDNRVGGFLSVARERGRPNPSGIMVNAVGAGMETGELPSSPLEEKFSYADFVFSQKKQ